MLLRSTGWLAAAMLAMALTTAGAAADPPQNLLMHHQPQPVPDLQFADADGQPHTLAEFHGKVVLLNIWATWCSGVRSGGGR
jgi:thiol-disulfide isomerase/thioredoxin